MEVRDEHGRAGRMIRLSLAGVAIAILAATVGFAVGYGQDRDAQSPWEPAVEEQCLVGADIETRLARPEAQDVSATDRFRTLPRGLGVNVRSRVDGDVYITTAQGFKAVVSETALSDCDQPGLSRNLYMGEVTCAPLVGEAGLPDFEPYTVAAGARIANYWGGPDSAPVVTS